MDKISYRKKAEQSFCTVNREIVREKPLIVNGAYSIKIDIKNIPKNIKVLSPSMKKIAEISSRFENMDFEMLENILKIQTVFLITNSSTEAMKAARLLFGLFGNYFADGHPEFDSRPFLYRIDQNNVITKDDHIEYGEMLKRIESGFEYYELNNARTVLRAILIDGLDTDKDIRERLDFIEALPFRVRFVRISEKMTQNLYIKEMKNLYPDEYPMIRLPEPDTDYYLQVTDSLLKGTKARFKDEDEKRSALFKMMRYSGEAFNEEYIGFYLDKGLDKNSFDLNRMFSDNDPGKMSSLSAIDRLMSMPGLKEPKRCIEDNTALFREESRNPKLILHKNMIFTGNPGTGKTTVARLTAEIMSELGAAKPVFAEVSRADLIGKYLGHTAPKVKDAFDRARGGVLFVDEAGFFANSQGRDIYSNEALKEFVRYMENYPDVVVIFAMYSSEVDRFLKLDDGLRSRISTIVDFEDYSGSELCDIVRYMLKNSGYEPAYDEREIAEFFAKERRNPGFGNARAARKLVEHIILSKSLSRRKETDSNMEITDEHILSAIERLKTNNRVDHRNIGFLADNVKAVS